MCREYDRRWAKALDQLRQLREEVVNMQSEVTNKRPSTKKEKCQSRARHPALAGDSHKKKNDSKDGTETYSAHDNSLATLSYSATAADWRRTTTEMQPATRKKAGKPPYTKSASARQTQKR